MKAEVLNCAKCVSVCISIHIVTNLYCINAKKIPQIWRGVCMCVAVNELRELKSKQDVPHFP